MLWHVPAAYDAALEHHALLHLEHLTYVATGLLLWWPVLQSHPWSLSSGGEVRVPLRGVRLRQPARLLLWRSSRARSTTSTSTPRGWGLSPLADQQLAGIAMAVSEAIVFFTMFTVFFVRFMAEEEAGEAEQPGG